ncbi:MAG: hypothetical protein E7606_03055 [Ruminococcaceae bacterium]|nr:hypothetical protein [Oscillospiraceae bacterium]
MKQQRTLYQLEIVEERRADDRIYTLLRLERGALLRYAVCIEDRAGIEIAWIGDRDEECRSFFDKLVKGSLSSVHLTEVATDFSYRRSLEIF